jgi:P-type E1-E2 ATPase
MRARTLPLRGAGFCGDGANDVGALRGASVGLSLCEAEASVAAPLTARGGSPASMVDVVAEGRCALATSQAIFKYIIVYAFVQVRAAVWGWWRDQWLGLCCLV